MKITKTRLKTIIKEELENLNEAGDVTDVIVTAMQNLPKVAQGIQILQRKNNPQLVANLLVKIHKLVRPEGNIADLFTKAKGTEEKMAAVQPLGAPEDEAPVAERRHRRRR